MTTLLIAEHDNLALNGQTAQALTAANALGQPVDILVAGAGCAAVASAAAAPTPVPFAVARQPASRLS